MKEDLRWSKTTIYNEGGSILHHLNVESQHNDSKSLNMAQASPSIERCFLASGAKHMKESYGSEYYQSLSVSHYHQLATQNDS
jgi:hypothetical protein